MESVQKGDNGVSASHILAPISEEIEEQDGILSNESFNQMAINSGVVAVRGSLGLSSTCSYPSYSITTTSQEQRPTCDLSSVPSLYTAKIAQTYPPVRTSRLQKKSLAMYIH